MPRFTAMAHHSSAVGLSADSKFADSLPQIPCLSNPRIPEPDAELKNGRPKPTYKFLTSALAASLLFLQPMRCNAAVASLPWDHTLVALQDMLVAIVAPAAIGLAFTGAAILYALGGHDEQAGRLFGAGIGGCLALAVVYLLNYVLP
jgi:hypothetical protein